MIIAIIIIVGLAYTVSVGLEFYKIKKLKEDLDKDLRLLIELKKRICKNN